METSPAKTNFLLTKWQHIVAMTVKEFHQLRRDRGTFGMIFFIPIVQLIIFGVIINLPKHLPTVVIANENSPVARSIVAGLKLSNYFDLKEQVVSFQDAEKAMLSGDVQVLIEIPNDLSRKLIRQERPVIGVVVDAADPNAVSGSVSNIGPVVDQAVKKNFKGVLANTVKIVQKPYELRIHQRYNPEGIMYYNIIPGLIGMIMTMTLIMITAMSIVREKERGSMENLLATPITAGELMLGKMFPYLLIAFLQFAIILVAAFFVFKIPLIGSLFQLSVALMVFALVNLSLGLTISTIAKNQVQAFQLSFFYFLPSLMLSGFLFNYFGMPPWAQILSEIFPLTHFIRLTRGIILKGATLIDLSYDILCLLILAALALAVAMFRFHKTID